MRCAAKIRASIACICMSAMLATAAPHPATAQTAPFPTKPIRIVIPFAAGGFADITMRVLADKLGERLNQRVIIENRPGGGGVVAAQAVTSSPADGYTLFVLAKTSGVPGARRRMDSRTVKVPWVLTVKSSSGSVRLDVTAT